MSTLHKYKIFIIFVLGLLLRTLLIWSLEDRGFWGDTASYIVAADKLKKGFQVPFWPPGLVYFIYFWTKMFGWSVWSIRMTALFFYVIFFFASIFLAKVLKFKKYTAFVAIFVSFYPEFIFHSAETLTQLPNAAFLLVALIFMFKSIKPKTTIFPILAGISLGIMILFRPSSLLLAGALPILIAFKSKNYKNLILSYLATFLIVFSWINYIHSKSKQWIFINTANKENLYLGNNPQTPIYKTWWLGSHFMEDEYISTEYLQKRDSIQHLPTEKRNEFYQKASINYIISNPHYFLLRSLNRVRVYFAFDSFSGALLMKSYHQDILGGIYLVLSAGIFIGLFSIGILFFSFKKDFTNILLIATILSLAIPYFIAFSHPVYHFPILIPLTLFFLHNFKAEALKKTFTPRKLLFLGIFLFIQIEWLFYNL